MKEKMKSEPLTLERTLRAPVARVWEAITDREQMKKWYFDMPDFKPEVGCRFQFEGSDGDRKFVHLCEVTEVAPGKKLVYSWRYEGLEGISFVTFELFAAADDSTRLRLTHEGLDTFPAGDPSLRRENFEQGWTAIIGRNLKEFVEN